ncbi:MAG: ketoacyl-ACP synthase III, partial [Candidatus Omnitrophica bacterium]|nr:ketoacyl-ACP synthase III [Candidatus Omnitrophota bacterium]
MDVKISAVEYFLPKKVLSNTDLERQFYGWDADKVEKKIGIKSRHIVDENETAMDLAYEAAIKVFKNFNKEKIDFLIFCTQSPDYYLPSCACILQDRLHLKTTVGAFDINQGCSGYIYGLAVAKGLIQSKIARHILFITAETYTKHIYHKDKSNRTIFGDAASATIIEKSENRGIFEFVFGTDGSGAKNLIVPNGGLRNRYNLEEKEVEDYNGNIRTDNNLYMNGPEIFKFTIDAVPKIFSEILRVNGLDLDTVDYIIFHQANKYMIEYLRDKIKIPRKKFYLDLVHVGNTVS